MGNDCRSGEKHRKMTNWGFHSTAPHFILILLFLGVSAGRGIMFGNSSGSDKDRFHMDEKIRLRTYLLQNYSNDLLPLRNHSETMIVHLEFILRAVSHMSLKTQVLKVNGWLIFEWTDELLRWNPDDFDGITHMIFRKSEIWNPSLQMDNPKEQVVIGNDQMTVYVQNTGRVRFEPGVIMETMCPVVVTKYPFDTQICYIILISWTYSIRSLLLQSVSSRVPLTHLIPNGEWRVVSSDVMFITVPSMHRKGIDHTALMFTLRLERRTLFYMLNTIIPVMLLSTLNMLVFILPADCGERMSVAVSALVSYTVYLDIISEDIPRTSEHTSTLTVFLTMLLGLSTGSVMMAGFCLNIHYRSVDVMVPHWLRWIYTNYFMVDDPMEIKRNKVRKKLSGLEEKVEKAMEEREKEGEIVASSTAVESSQTNLDGKPKRQRMNKNQGEDEGKGRTLSEDLATQFAKELRRIIEERRRKQVCADINWHDIGNALDSVMFWVFLIGTNTLTCTMLYLLLR